jgi:DNA-binding MurR/RpiR family transcriptional regulator
MDKNLEARAAAAKLTASDKKVLDFILRDRRKACFMTSNEIATQLDISPSSVVRLSKKLGCDSFAAFRRELQLEVAGLDQSVTKLVPHERISRCENVPDGTLLAAYMENTIAQLQSGAAPENDKKIAEAADLITKAKRVFIVGFRSCWGYAAAMGVMFSCVRPGVYAVGNNGPLVDALVDLTRSDVMIAISFARYSSDTAFAAQMARAAGCKIIAMTDSYAAPIARGAAKVIISDCGNLGSFDSYVGLLANMEKILMLVSKRNKKTNEERLKKMDTYLEKTGQY